MEGEGNHIAEVAAVPVDLPRSVRFDGILEGTCGEQEPLEAALRDLDALGIPHFEVSYEGEHCSLLVSDAVLPGERFTPSYWETLHQALQRVVACFVPGAEVETTLRCSERFADREKQTLFVHDAHGLRMVSRLRTRPSRGPGGLADRSGREDEDAEAGGDDLATAPRSHRRHALILLGLFLVVGMLVIWNQGLLFRLHPVPPAGITLDPGPFKGLLEVTTTVSWGTYHLTVGRGAAFPGAATATAPPSAATVGVHAATTLAAEGGEIYLVLESPTHRVLAVTVVSLRPLLESAAGHATCELPGDFRAGCIRCALAAPEGGE